MSETDDETTKSENTMAPSAGRRIVTVDAEEFEALQRRLIAVERSNEVAATAEVVRLTCNHCGKDVPASLGRCTAHPAEFVNHEGVKIDPDRGGRRPAIMKQTRA